ncbi:N-formimino-L-glutamate deiminase [compost metagenome]
MERQHGSGAAQRGEARLGLEVGLRRTKAEVHVRVDQARQHPQPLAIDRFAGLKRRTGFGNDGDAAVNDAQHTLGQALLRQQQPCIGQ